MAENFYAGAEAIKGELKTQQKKYKDAKVTAEKLPYALKDEYRKAGDPKLDAAIVNSEQEMMGGAIEGLNKFQNVENPFARRDLAEKHQGSLSKTYGHFTSEKERRQGVIQDYIAMWSGTYGAVAMGEQIDMQNMESQYNMEMQLGAKKEDEFRYNQDRNDRLAKEGRAAAEKTPGMIAEINELRNNDESWEHIAKYMAEVRGVDVGPGSAADKELRRVFGEDPLQEPEKPQTEKQKIDQRYYGLLNEISAGNSQYFEKDKAIYKRTQNKKWWKNDPDDELIMNKP